MTSKLYDEETVADPGLDLVQQEKAAPKKVSSLRRWGPAMIAIAVVVAVNAYIVGPTGNNMPAVSDKAQRKLELIEARNLAVAGMETPMNDRRLMSRSGVHGSRSLSEEEGGNMEYTRDRKSVV